MWRCDSRLSDRPRHVGRLAIRLDIMDAEHVDACCDAQGGGGARGADQFARRGRPAGRVGAQRAHESLAAGTPVIAQNAGSDVSSTYVNLCDTLDDFVSTILKKSYVSQPLPDMFEWEHVRERHIEFFNKLIRN